jgi:hypothetical protein
VIAPSAYEQTCLPFTLRHTGRRGGGALAAAAAGRGGGLTAGWGGRGGGDTFIACGGGLAAVDGGVVRSLSDPFDGEVLVTLAPAPGATLVTLWPAGVPFALCSLLPGRLPVTDDCFATPVPTPVTDDFFNAPAPDGGATCLATPNEGVVTSGCAGANGRVEGGKPRPGLGATPIPVVGVLTEST